MECESEGGVWGLHGCRGGRRRVGGGGMYVSVAHGSRLNCASIYARVHVASP